MYRQILVARKDRDYQRILWREDSSLPVKHYRLNTVTYGTSAAPFLATRVLYQIGEEVKATLPNIANIIQNDFYVDDLLSGAESIKEAVNLQNHLINILSASGLPLVKWRSNSTILEANNSNNANRESLHIDDNSGITKVLGVQWDPADDAFFFKVSTDFAGADTKRKILSESSRVFDPLGWLSPVIIAVKILFQRLWLNKCGWDETLPNEVIQCWEVLRSELPAIAKIKIPRQIYLAKLSLELHGFADASELAYAAVIYCRSIDEEDLTTVRIIASKTKVAPLKQITLPRLELCAALLLTRLFERVIRALSIDAFTIYAWTDSSIVLAWLADTPRRWKTYIANRTSEILETLPSSCWKHVRSEDNPADCASRGITPSQLVNHKLWWQGPPWLRGTKDQWPSNLNQRSATELQKEERKIGVLSHFQELPNDTLLELSYRFSNFRKLLRVVAYCFRFISNLKRLATDKATSFLSAKEINGAKTVIIKWMQETAYSKEIKDLKMKHTISSKSPLQKLCPFLDNQEVMRIGGRIQNSNCCFSVQHPIILPRNHPITRLIILDNHQTYFHPGPSLLISIIRQRYWIPSIRTIVRKVCWQCITCFRQTSKSTTQLMGILPKSRVTISRPFSQVGVDYAGPITLTSKIGRGSKAIKGYIALFVCFSTKAVHLELVSSLSSEAFVAAFRRFAARRGVPKDVYSDNGTNFVGARRYLNDMHKLSLSVEKDALISSFLSEQNITWHFIPPGAPNFGGLWEAAVRSVKWHLRRVLGETLLGFEEMTTLLTQIEAILNSRPICGLSNDVDDFNALTPAHFLVGDASTVLPQEEHVDQKVSYLRRWQLIQAMTQGFWKRWRLDYLSSLQERQRWTKERDSLREGDLVILREDNVPPARWLMGRVLHTHPGPDNLVRVVSVKTTKGIFKRAINRISRLPVSQEN